MDSPPPEYVECQHKFKTDVNKKVIKNIIQILDSIPDFEQRGISTSHSNSIRWIMNAFDKNYLYEEFSEQYDYITNKLISPIF